jgi:cellulose synthase/poly-beta-1,6-N-acetylglucosamine synthase-like glycosyltransferase
MGQAHARRSRAEVTGHHPISRSYPIRAASGLGRSTNGLGSGRDRNPTPSTGTEPWPLVSVVVPTLNEAQNLPSVLPRIPTWVHEVVVVDGGSTDGTVDIVRRLRDDAIVIQQR